MKKRIIDFGFRLLNSDYILPNMGVWFLLGVLSVPSCRAADTPHLAKNTGVQAIDNAAAIMADAKSNRPPAEVIARWLTNDVPTRRIFNFDGEGKPTSLTNEYVEKVWLVPVQRLPWYNPATNGWEVVELQITQPRLISETTKTNFQLQSR